ncbi:MAG: hypothetical protein GX660_26910 [Clostridiaceae bacterium]|nr:hypothetical protein [Clostridiaceae bacterium]
MKRVLMGLLTVIMVLGAVCLSLWAVQPASAEVVAYDVTGGQLQYDTETGAIIGYSGEPTDVVIPDTIDGVSVISIGKFAFDDCTLFSVENARVRITLFT